MSKAVEHWQDLSVSELEKQVHEAQALIAKARALLPGLDPLLDDERAHLVRVRDGEESAIEATLRAAEVRPAMFQSIADRDGGKDPKAFETDFLRDLLKKRSLVAGLSGALSPFAQSVSDAVLSLGADVKEPASLAYRIASGVRDTDAQVREALGPATAFYGAIAAKSAKTRKKKTP